MKTTTTILIAIVAALSACGTTPALYATADVQACRAESVASNMDQAAPGFVPLSGTTPLLAQRNYEKAQRQIFLACLASR